MRLEISGEQQEATFRCEFCDTEYSWPFTANISPSGEAFPKPSHVIMSHHFGDSNLSKFGFRQCPEWGKWRDTTWELIDRDKGATLVASGPVRIVEGYPSITD